MKKIKGIIKNNNILKFITLRIYKILIKIYDRITSVECDVSIGDLMLQRTDFDWGPFIAVSRYLDTVRYCQEDKYFVYEALLSNKRLPGEVYISEFKDEEFEILIKDISEKGYNENSLVSVDKQITLFNGTHRIGICLYFGIYNVRVRIYRRKYSVAMDDFYIRKVESEVLTEISEAYRQVENLLISSGHTFCVLGNGLKENQKENMIQDMSILSRILKTTPKNDSLMIQFALKNPEYLYKQGKIFSARSLQISEILKIRYPDNEIKVSLNCLEGANLYKEFSMLNDSNNI